MQIRRATVNDAALLARLNEPVQRLHAEARPEIFKLPEPDDQTLIVWFSDVLRKPDSYVYIGEVEGQAVGCVIAQIIRRLENPFAYPMEWILIDQISVNPEHQRQGYGKLLLDAVLELARAENIKRVILDVWGFNANAIGFYKKQGFQVFNERMEIGLG